MSVQVWCLSFRQPYAGLVLDGVKTVESRWRPLLAPLENQTLGVHIAQRDWEGEEWRAVLSGTLGMNRVQIQTLLESGERFGRGVVAGLVDVGGTWLCPASLQGEELQCMERSAVLIGLQEKHLTHLSNPRWLKEPLSVRGVGTSGPWTSQLSCYHDNAHSQVTQSSAADVLLEDSSDADVSVLQEEVSMLALPVPSA